MYLSHVYHHCDQVEDHLVFTQAPVPQQDLPPTWKVVRFQESQIEDNPS